ncbi:MAG: hypothetical protein ACYTGN_06065 [Planctomycetota bacterium]|jgi:hypothetical protein
MRASVLALLLSVVSLGGVVVIYVKLDGLEKRVATQRTERSDAVDREFEARTSSSWDTYPPPADASPPDAGEEGTDDAPVTRKEVDERFENLRTQVDQVAALVEDGRLRIEELLKTPGRDGTSPYDRREKLYGMVRESIRTGNWDATKPALVSANFRDEPVPGRDTTYGEAVDGLVKETHASIVGTLTEEQRAAFENVEIAPMVNDGGLAPREIFHAVEEQLNAEAAAEADGQK